LSGLLGPLVERRAVRGLDTQALAPEQVRRIFEGAVLAPSFANKQPWRFVAVQKQPLLDAVRGTLSEGNYWAKSAPLLVAAWTHLDYDGRLPGGRDFALFDLGQAVFALQIQAQSEGLVTHPMAGFDAEKAAQVLGLPEGAIVPVLITVSYQGGTDGLNEKHREIEASPRSRKPLEEVVAFR